MNNKNGKRALLASVLSLAVCGSMLAGTTFAWFTDNVSSNSNVIKAGNLDVDVQYTLDGENWKGLSEANDLFQKGLWEPGHTEVVALKISNVGSLALKYKVDLKIVSETKGTNAAGEDIVLSEILQAGTAYNAAVENGNKNLAGEGLLAQSFASHKFAQNIASQPLNEYVVKEETTLLVNDAHYLIVALEMPETVSNEANYVGETVPTIDFGINVIATQATVEKDSFGSLYDAEASFNSYPVSNFEALKIALANQVKNIVLVGNCYAYEALNVDYDVNIDGNGRTIARNDGYTGTIFTVKPEAALTLEDVVVDGGAVWSGEVDATLQRGTTNSGVKATGNLIAAENNSRIILNEDAILQNNEGVYAVNLGTRIGATLTVNGGQIVNNQSEAGAIWGGGNIIINSGKLNGNSSTGFAGVIRMVSSCNLTVNGGEINHNKAAGDGGVIWGYGSSTYTFTGGEMAYNESAGTGGAIYTGTYSVINISGDFEMHDNKAANSGAIRLTDYTSLTMTGGKIYNNTQNGESNAFNTWNNSISITGGSISDDFSYVGGLGLTIGAADIGGVIAYNLSTTHNTAYLAKDFKGFEFTVNAEAANFANFNFKPADGYVYTEGDEAKLVCLNEGYATYWDATTGTFRLKAN